jgi:hypothetical protein
MRFAVRVADPVTRLCNPIRLCNALQGGEIQ